LIDRRGVAAGFAISAFLALGIFTASANADGNRVYRPGFGPNINSQ
jgi:hypothetical protein